MKYYALILLLFLTSNIFAQDSIVNVNDTNTNRVVFSELYGGLGAGGNGLTIFGGANLNYQYGKDNLLTFRYTGFGSYKRDYFVVGFLPFPILVRSEGINEYALLYGKRYINGSQSLGFSAGIALNDRTFYQFSSGLNNYNQISQINFGIPFELNIKWFKPRKQRFRAYYGIIPIGKREVSFGRSFGFKLIGNVSKSTSIGFGITYGFGWHKKY